MNKKRLFLFFVVSGFSPIELYSQGISINTTGAVNSSLSMIEILQISNTANSKGLYISHSGMPITGTGYGLWSEITGTNTTNIAAYLNAANATDNYALIVPPGGGIVGIGTTTPNSGYLFTLLTNATNSKAIDITLTGGSGNGVNVTSSSSNYNNIVSTNSGSASATYYAVGGLLTSTVSPVAGYLGYHTGTGNTAVNYFGGYFRGKVAVTSSSSPDGIADLEVQNTTSGAGNPATIFLRQTTSNDVSGTVLSNLNFGDNRSTSPQAQIQVIRSAAGGIGDQPTDILFYTTPDGSTTLTERVRITNSGQFQVGTSTAAATTFSQFSPTSGGGFLNGLVVIMPASTNSTNAINVTNNDPGGTGNKYGFRANVGGNDGTVNNKYGFYGQTTGNAGTGYGGRFESVISTGTGTNYGVYGYVSGAVATNYALYGEVGAYATNNYALGLKDGHIKSIGTSPTITSSTYTTSISNATDIAGAISITTTTSTGSATITFNRSYAIPPIVLLTPTNQNAAADISRVWVTSTTTTFTIHFAASIAANSKTFNYLVIETQ